MDKMFKLPRNHRQTGPYTFGELGQLGLQLYHLNWADGRIGGCSCPAELDASKVFNDLQPGESLTLKAPGHKKAASVTANQG